MFRNNYDNDVSVWSPQGRLLQVEYAMEAVNQGSATIGLKNKTHAILVALKRAPNELTSHQKKIFEVDEHFGVSYAGLLSDGHLLGRFLSELTNDWKKKYGTFAPMGHIRSELILHMQPRTQGYSYRPFGVGLLLAGYDEAGPHVLRSDPSANVEKCKAMAIGARSQSARTYLLKHLDEFEECDLDSLIIHGLTALGDTLPAEIELTAENASLGVVGEETPFRLIEGDEITAYLERVRANRQEGQQPQQQ